MRRGAAPIRPLVPVLLVALLTPAPAESQPPAPSAAGTFHARPLPGPRADIAALLLTGSDGGPLVAAALAVAGCGPEVDYWIELEGSQLVDAAGAEAESLRLELYVYAVSAQGGIAASQSRWVRLPIEGLRDAGSGVKLAGRLELAPGDYLLRMLAREPRSQQFALRVAAVTVTEPGPETASVGPPLFEERDPGWIVAHGPAEPSGVPPAALPVLVSGGERRLWLTGCGAEDDPAVRLLDAGGEPLADLELATEASAATAAEPRPAILRLPGVAPGAYQLEVAAAGGAGSSSRLPVAVVEDAMEETASAWPSLQRLVADPDAGQEALDLAEERRAEKRIVVVAEAYRGVVERLAAGDLEAAVARLQRLDRDILATGRRRMRDRRSWLAGLGRVAGQLAREEPECLLPLLSLHLETYGRYLDDGVGDAWLLDAERERIVQLAREYAARSKSELAAALTATALAELGVALARTRDRLGAQRVLEEAIALDGGNPATLLELAHLFEHAGAHAEAVQTLERLLASQPGSDEGRLRLALNLRRLGRLGEAERGLRRVVADAATEWVLALAYQELGRQLVDEGRLEAAARALEEAVARLPEVPGLYVQLAYVLDRLGSRQAGLEVIDRAPTATRGLSPRLLYSRRSDSAARASRAELLRHGVARQPLLRLALARAEAGG